MHKFTRFSKRFFKSFQRHLVFSKEVVKDVIFKKDFKELWTRGMFSKGHFSKIEEFLH